MVKIIILSREGNIIFEEIYQKTLNELLKITDNQYINQDLEILYTLNNQDFQLILLGSTNNLILRENIHEFQKPMENTIFFGHLTLLKICKKFNEIIDINDTDCQKIVNIQN